MEVIDVDARETQTLQASLQRFGKMLWAGIVRPLIRTRTFPATLGGDDQIGGVGVERFGNQLFRYARTVRICGVNQVDAEFYGLLQGSECSGFVCRRAPDSWTGEAHGAIAHAVHLEVA